ncbi:MAG: hypothetical protein JXR19_07265 [Bacteroidia bacterium]
MSKKDLQILAVSLMILGIVVFIVAVLFKILHWPRIPGDRWIASIAIVLGIIAFGLNSLRS